jgi:hypothetical protein
MMDGPQRRQAAIVAIDVVGNRVERKTAMPCLEQFSINWSRNRDPSDWFNCFFLESLSMF